ncbi:MAG: energy transducer TonB [Telluria sp.]
MLVQNWRVASCAFVLGIMVVSGAANAAGVNDKPPVKAAPNAPGTIKFDSCAKPAYPDEEPKQNYPRTVTLRFMLDADGKVQQSMVATSSGFPALDDAALVAISKCSFNSPMADGKAVAAWTHVQYVWQP